MKTLAAFCIAVAGLALIAGANYLIAVNPPESVPILPEARPPGASVVSAPGDVPPLSMNIQLTHAQARPLFTEGRKPWAAPPPPPVAEVAPEPVAIAEPEMAPAAPPQPLSVSLLGVQKDGGGARALITTGANPEATWIRSGETVDGWTVTAIDNESVKFALGDRTETVELYTMPPAGAPL